MRSFTGHFAKKITLSCRSARITRIVAQHAAQEAEPAIVSSPFHGEPPDDAFQALFHRDVGCLA